MRLIISAFAALAIGSVAATPGVAQTQSSGSLSQAFNACVELARQRGWSESDLDVSRRDVRNFVMRCIQGQGARAEAQQKPRKQKR
jgi:hypothetical protein